VILVVDDDPDIRDTLELALSLEGFEVRCAADGIEALDSLARGPAPQLILLDLRMPRMNGLEFLAVAKNDGRLAAIPVVVLTADATAAEEALAAGATAVQKKPFEADELTAIARRHTQRRRAA
jgi:CheY-like chemotaxis protein